MRKKQIKNLNSKLKHDREELKALRLENVEKNKLVSNKREELKQISSERGNELTQDFTSGIEDVSLPKKRRVRNRIEVKNERVS